MATNVVSRMGSRKTWMPNSVGTWKTGSSINYATCQSCGPGYDWNCQGSLLLMTALHKVVCSLCLDKRLNQFLTIANPDYKC